MTYWALDWGLWAIVFTVAVSQAIGYGLAYAPTVGATLKVWFLRRKILANVVISVVSGICQRLVCLHRSGWIWLRLSGLGAIANCHRKP